MSPAAALDVFDDIASISDFGKGKYSKIFARAEHRPQYILKNNTPSYVIIDFDEYKQQMDALEDLYDYELAVQRLEANEGKPTISREENMKLLGLTQADIDAAPEVTIE